MPALTLDTAPRGHSAEAIPAATNLRPGSDDTMQLDDLKASKRQIIARHVRPSNRKALTMALTTLLPLAALFYAMVAAAGVSYWLSAALVLAAGLFLIRAFVLMHECGHGSLFRTGWLNRTFGFVLGVLTG